MPYAGALQENLDKTISKIKSTMCNCGAASIEELQRIRFYFDIDTDKQGWKSKLAMYSMVYQMMSQTTSDWMIVIFIEINIEYKRRSEVV